MKFFLNSHVFIPLQEWGSIIQCQPSVMTSQPWKQRLLSAGRRTWSQCCLFVCVSMYPCLVWESRSTVLDFRIFPGLPRYFHWIKTPRLFSLWQITYRRQTEQMKTVKQTKILICKKPECLLDVPPSCSQENHVICKQQWCNQKPTKLEILWLVCS